MSRQIVESVLQAHASLITVPNGEKFETRRRSLLVVVIDAVGGRARWKILKKSGAVPSDIIVDTNNDHYDVFSGRDNGDGTSTITANWTNYGDFNKSPANVNKLWRARTVEEAFANGWIEPLPGALEPEEPLPQPDEPTPDTTALWARVRKIEERIEKHLKD